MSIRWKDETQNKIKQNPQYISFAMRAVKNGRDDVSKQQKVLKHQTREKGRDKNKAGKQLDNTSDIQILP
jgi:hypothetical protein